MSDSVVDAARCLQVAADVLHAIAADVASAEVGAGVFGDEAPGRLGELGRALRRQTASALRMRGDEARDLAVRADTLAEGCAAALDRYAVADEVRPLTDGPHGLTDGTYGLTDGTPGAGWWAR